MAILTEETITQADHCNDFGLPIHLESVSENREFKRHLIGLIVVKDLIMTMAEKGGEHYSVDATKTSYSANTIRHYTSQGLKILKTHSALEKFSKLRSMYAVKMINDIVTVTRKDSRLRKRNALISEDIKEANLEITEEKHIPANERINDWLEDITGEDYLKIEGINFTEELLAICTQLKQDGMIYDYVYHQAIKTLVLLRTDRTEDPTTIEE